MLFCHINDIILYRLFITQQKATKAITLPIFIQVIYTIILVAISFKSIIYIAYFHLLTKIEVVSNSYTWKVLWYIGTKIPKKN